MNNLIINQYNNIISNQIRLKLKQEFCVNFWNIKKISLFSNFFRIESFKNLELIESLFFFRLITNKKAYISYVKKRYKEYDFIIKLDLTKKHMNFFLLNYVIFFLPIIRRREISFKKKFNEGKNFVFVNNLYNIFPFLPDVFFSFQKKIQYELLFKTKNKKYILLFLKYYGFPIPGEK